MTVGPDKINNMKTYVINLKDDVLRREYMHGQLRLLPPSLSVEFVEAVDGRAMSQQESENKFDAEKFLLRYRRKVRPGEVGCTLSHQKCYEKLMRSGEKYALILEDDIVVRTDVCSVFPQIEKMVDTDKPLVVLLSGRYWFLGTKRITQTNYRVANVYDAYLAQSYVINRAAAALSIESRPFVTSDDWFYIRKKGVKIRAILPHLIDQDWSGTFPSTINNVKRESCEGMWKRKFQMRWHKRCKSVLKRINHYETTLDEDIRKRSEL